MYDNVCMHLRMCVHVSLSVSQCSVCMHVCMCVFVCVWEGRNE